MRVGLSLVRLLAWLPLAALPLACSGSSSDAAPEQAEGPTCTLAWQPQADWRLRAEGTTLRDAQHRVVLLRGVNAGGRSKVAPFMPFDFDEGSFDAALSAYLDRAAAWGINVLRVPFVWAAVEPSKGMDDAEFLRRYDALLDAAWARGIWTVVDFHQDVYAEILCGDGFPSWTLPEPLPAPLHDCPQWSLEYASNADVKAAFDRFWAEGSPVQADYLAMWKRMAERYRDRPGVLGFEPINEPAWGTKDPDAFEATTLSEFYDRVATMLRQIAPSSLVFVDPLGFDGVSATTTLRKTQSDGVVFAPHYYPLGKLPPEDILAGLGRWAEVGKSWNAPVWVGEFGASHDRKDVVEFMSYHFDAMDALGLGGTIWEYSVTKDLWNHETNSLIAADGAEYPVLTSVVRPFAHAVAGEEIKTSFDTGAGVFSLTYKPMPSGITEVSLPSRVYPKGFDVAVTGACVDSSHPGKLLLQSHKAATSVELRVTPRP